MTESKQEKSGGNPRFPALYPILDAELALRGLGPDPQLRRESLRRIVQELADIGVGILQYRNKCDRDEVVAADAHEMREAATHAGRTRIRLILNDRAALVPGVGWAGVHVGQEDLPPRQARLLVGEGALVGLSTHNEQQLNAADKEPVDYIAIGPVFATASKRDTSPVIGLDGLRRARVLTQKPLVAIGGITLETAASVYEAGADSLAVIAAIFAAPGRSPAQSAKDFLEIFS
ncbi:MAG: thiamine phosphate synthase [Acidobacteriaceae bacterium]